MGRLIFSVRTSVNPLRLCYSLCYSACAMKRRLFNIFSALSLMLFLTTGALWVRSYWVADAVRQLTAHQGEAGIHELSVASMRGSISVLWAWGPKSSDVTLGLSYSGWARPSPFNPPAELRGFDYRSRGAAHVVPLPYWAFLLPTAFLPAAWLIREDNRRRRVRQGHCAKCGYDLCASTDRCPECGRPIPPVQQTLPHARPE